MTAIICSIVACLVMGMCAAVLMIFPPEIIDSHNLGAMLATAVFVNLFAISWIATGSK
jgi:hypothetical protein